MALGRRTADRANVSTVRFFHDNRSADDGAGMALAMFGRVAHCCRGDGFAPQWRGRRALLCALPSRTGRKCYRHGDPFPNCAPKPRSHGKSGLSFLNRPFRSNLPAEFCA